jgi:hypothetical protein
VVQNILRVEYFGVQPVLPHFYGCSHLRTIAAVKSAPWHAPNRSPRRKDCYSVQSASRRPQGEGQCIGRSGLNRLVTLYLAAPSASPEQVLPALQGIRAMSGRGSTTHVGVTPAGVTGLLEKLDAEKKALGADTT